MPETRSTSVEHKWTQYTEPAADVGVLFDFSLLHKQGIKLWADGSPWVGTCALSFHVNGDIEIKGTWIGGHRIDLDDFLATVQATDPTGHAHLATAAKKHCC